MCISDRLLDTVESDGEDKVRTVFHGVFVAARVPRRFEGLTLFGPADRIETMRKLASGVVLERVKLEDPMFDRALPVFGTDQVEARYLLEPRLIEGLTALCGAHAHSIAGLFWDGALYLALETKRDRYEPAFEKYTDAEGLETLRRLTADLAIHSDIVRILRLDEESHLAR